MKRARVLVFALAGALGCVLFASSGYAQEGSINTQALRRGLADALYCKLVGCTMTGALNSQAIIPTADNAYSLGNGTLNFQDANLTRNLRLFNGASTTLFSNGTTNVSGDLVFSASTLAATAATGALAGAGAGNVNNTTHSYKITFLTATGETEAGAKSNVVTVADKTVNGQIALSAIPTGPIGIVTGRNVYRSTAGDAGPWFLVAASPVIANNTATTYTDNASDATISLLAQAPAANTTNDARATIANGANRLTVVGTSSVLVGSGATTQSQYAFFQNSVGQSVFGQNNHSANAIFGTGSTADSTVFGTLTSTQAEIGTGGTIGYAMDTSQNSILTQTATLGWGSSGMTTADTFIKRRAAATLQLGAADVNGTPVAQKITSQGAVTGTNLPGGAIEIAGGPGTGNGAGQQATIDRYLMLGTGATQQSTAHAVVICESKTLSNTSATAQTIATIGLASNSGGGLHAMITLVATDGTNFDSETQDVTVSYVNKATVITIGTPLVTTSTAANNSGSATIGATVTGASPTISLKVTPVFTTIVPTTVTEYVEIHNHGTGAVTCQ